MLVFVSVPIIGLKSNTFFFFSIRPENKNSGWNFSANILFYSTLLYSVPATVP